MIMDERTARVAYMPILLIRPDYPTFDARVPISPKDIKRTMTPDTMVILPKDAHN